MTQSEIQNTANIAAGNTSPASSVSASYRFVKRAFDIAVSFLGLVILSPVLLIVAAVIFIDDPHASPIYVQTRVGKGGKEFRFCKFRTMIAGADKMLDELADKNEADGPVFKMRNDPRITRVGRFLRAWSIDELPNLWNVLKGDMSLVGPRPPLPNEVAHYTPYQKQRLNAKVGIVCYWQVMPHRNDCSFDDWVELDLKYIREMSVRTDLKILLHTFRTVMRKEGI